jgi:hypothetical protein
MAATQETSKNTEPHINKIDPTAPAGSENSLGEESIRDGRPATGDDVVEAIDEEGPGIEEEPGV